MGELRGGLDGSPRDISRRQEVPQLPPPDHRLDLPPVHLVVDQVVDLVRHPASNSPASNSFASGFRSLWVIHRGSYSSPVSVSMQALGRQDKSGAGSIFCPMVVPSVGLITPPGPRIKAKDRPSGSDPGRVLLMRL